MITVTKSGFSSILLPGQAIMRHRRFLALQTGTALPHSLVGDAVLAHLLLGSLQARLNGCSLAHLLAVVHVDALPRRLVPLEHYNPEWLLELFALHPPHTA